MSPTFRGRRGLALGVKVANGKVLVLVVAVVRCGGGRGPCFGLGGRALLVQVADGKVLLLIVACGWGGGGAVRCPSLCLWRRLGRRLCRRLCRRLGHSCGWLGARLRGLLGCYAL